MSLALLKPKAKPLEEVVSSVGIYSADGYRFVLSGLTWTAQKLHGKSRRKHVDRHVSGPQLCEGLRDIALERYGPLATMVLGVWGIHGTIDFGHIVFALVDAGMLFKRPCDTVDDFRDVYDFADAFSVQLVAAERD
jgi:uncharacterized repeat protein (TIGR04138 family)